MRRQDVQVPAPGGRCHGTLHLPDGDGPWPGVLVFPDAGGARETFGRLGDRLAGLGYVVLVGATGDSAFTADQAALLESALSAAGTSRTIEFYPAQHGFAVPDNPTYDAAAEAWHWAALSPLYRARLHGTPS